MSTFVGLRGSSKELELKSGNFWIFLDANLNDSCAKFEAIENVDEAIANGIPLLFVSFPSAKDPEWARRYPDRSACTLVSFGRPEWFTGKGVFLTCTLKIGKRF